MKKLSTAAALIGALGLAGTAFAQPIELITDQVSKLKFVNYENYIDTNGNGTIDAGDKFEGILKTESITNISGSVNKSAQLVTKELTGHFIISVTGGSLPLAVGSTGHLDFGLGTGDFINLYVGTGATKNWDPTGTVASGIANATDGDLWVSITGGTGFGYEGVNDSTAALFTPAISINRNWADLDINATGYSIVKKLYSTTAGEFPVHFKDVNNSGLFDAGDALEGDHLVDVYFASRLFINTDPSVPNWAFRSEDPVYVYTTVIPEPSTFLLLGAGLLGVGVAARRKIKHS